MNKNIIAKKLTLIAKEILAGKTDFNENYKNQLQKALKSLSKEDYLKVCAIVYWCKSAEDVIEVNSWKDALNIVFSKTVLRKIDKQEKGNVRYLQDWKGTWIFFDSNLNVIASANKNGWMKNNPDEIKNNYLNFNDVFQKIMNGQSFQGYSFERYRDFPEIYKILKEEDESWNN